MGGGGGRARGLAQVLGSESAQRCSGAVDSRRITWRHSPERVEFDNGAWKVV